MIISIIGKKDFYFPENTEKLEELKDKCLHTPMCVGCEYVESCRRMENAIGILPLQIENIYVMK